MLDRMSVVTLGPYVYVKERIRKRKAAKLLEKAELTESIRREELFTATYCCQQTDRRWTELSWPHTTSCQLSVTAKPLYYKPQTQFSRLTPPGVQLDSDTDSSFTDNLDPHLLICTTFWRSSLTLSKYKWRGGHYVDFGSLWPNEDKVKSVLREARHVTSLRHALGDLLRLCLRVGPLRMLKALLEEGIVDKNAVLDGGRSLLHVACIHGNLDAVLYLCTMDVTTDVMDHQGKTPRDVCRSDNIRRLLPNTATDLLLGSRSGSRSRTRSSEGQQVRRSEHDSTVNKKPLTSEIQKKIFELFHDISNWEDVTLLLQDYQFSVDTEQDEDGDLLVHIATKKGISHAGALLGLTLHFGASCDVTDTSGCTPLILTVCNDDDVMADVLLCVLGADINFPHPQTGWTALHYAANLNSLNFVSLLLKRGANVNAESADRLRADDICHKLNSDSAAYIQRARQARAASLSSLAAKGALTQQELYDEDMFVVDVHGDTLLMTAVRHNQPEQLTCLLRRRCSPIDAQNFKTGQTALSIAAQEDHVEIVHILLRSGAAPGVVDMSGWTAVMRATNAGHEAALTALLDYPSAWVGLQAALRLAQTRRIHLILTRTITKRQANLVTPALFEVAMTGSTRSVVRLLEDGDDINPASCAHDWPVYIAAANGHLQVVEFLHQRGGDLSCRHQTSGNTVLHVAAAGNHGAVVDFLLKHYACAGSAACRVAVNARNADGKTALQVASDKGYIRIVEKLLQAGASAAVTDSSGGLYQCRGYQGIQALLDKARHSHADLVFAALEKKNPTAQLQNLFLPEFDHNLRNDKGDTPLMVAAYLGKLDAINFLLQSAVATQPAFGRLSRSTSKTSLLDRISRNHRSRTDASHQGVYEEITEVTTPDKDSAVDVDFASGPWLDDRLQVDEMVSGVEWMKDGINRVKDRSDAARTEFDGMKCSLSNRLGGGMDREFEGRLGWIYRTCLNRRGYDIVHNDVERTGHGRNDLSRDGLDEVRGGLDGIKSRVDKGLNYCKMGNNEKYSPNKLTLEDYATWSQTTASLLYGHDGKSEPSTDLYDNTYHRHLYYLSASTAPSHVCSRSLRDGSTAVHRALQGGDRVEVVRVLLQVDSDVTNLQDEAGQTPLHVACRLGRRKAAKLLLAQSGTDINLRTLDGHLADELTTNTTLRRLVQEKRQPDTEQVFIKGRERLETPNPPVAPSEASSSISFDGINTRFVILKERWLARQRQQQRQKNTNK